MAVSGCTGLEGFTGVGNGTGKRKHVNSAALPTQKKEKGVSLNKHTAPVHRGVQRGAGLRSYSKLDASEAPNSRGSPHRRVGGWGLLEEVVRRYVEL